MFTFKINGISIELDGHAVVSTLLEDEAEAMFGLHDLPYNSSDSCV